MKQMQGKSSSNNNQRENAEFTISSKMHSWFAKPADILFIEGIKVKLV